MKSYHVHISPIKFDNLSSLIDAVSRIDNIRLYQSNKPYTDPDQKDVLDGNDLGSGMSVAYSYDTADLTLEINTHSGICATVIEEKGFAAEELVLGMIAEQFDFLDYMKSICLYQNQQATATIKSFINNKLDVERSINLIEYQSKF